MIPKDCKRLAEVDFPIAQVSKHAAREESLKLGHPRGLHLWWARRPLASCRAVLLAMLLPDPCDPFCPDGFKRCAREVLRRVPLGDSGTGDIALRNALIRFVSLFADWHMSTNSTCIEVAHQLVRASYDCERPLLLDPFAGGGAIPLEALRLGCDAVASDLNPIPVLINKVQLEYVPKYGSRLTDEFRLWATRLHGEVCRSLHLFYPNDEDGSIPIAYLWARLRTH